MNCNICSSNIEKHLLCSSCLSQIVKEKKEKIKALEQKIQVNDETFLKNSQNLKEIHQKNIKKVKNEQKESKLKIKIQESYLKNKEIKKKIEQLQIDNKKQKEILSEQKTLLENASKISTSTSFSFRESNEIEEKKKKKIEMLKTQLPITITNDGSSINICESIILPLDSTKFLSQPLEIINGSLQLFTTYLIILCDYLSIVLPFPLSTHINPMIKVEEKIIPLYYDEKKKEEYEKAISKFNLNVNFICSQVGIFVTKSNSENFIKNIFLLTIYPRLTEGDPILITEATTKRLESDGNNFYVENGSIINLVPLLPSEKKINPTIVKIDYF